MEHYAVPQQGQDMPAWFGKLPGMGDFAQRRLAPHFQQGWDNWLQRGLQQLRSQREDWVVHYLEAPLWCFALGEDVLGAKPWLGILMPSVDAVGRYFPLTLAIEMEHSAQGDSENTSATIRHWWSRSAKAALSALDEDMDAAGFETALHLQFGAQIDAPEAATAMTDLPAKGMSVWLANADAQNEMVHVVQGLPLNAAFDALFGCASLASVQR
jgi:type VI secretion system protein ImpM